MFQHILVPLDGSSLAESVLPHCEALAELCDAEVTVLHVLERGQPGDEQPIDAVDWYLRKAEAKVYLEDTVASLQDAGITATSKLLEGSAPERIVEYVRSSDVDLLLLSSHGQSGLTPWNAGSVAQKVVARAATSILIVRAYAPPPREVGYRRVLLPLDCSQRAEYVLPFANLLSRHHDAQLVLTHVVSRPEMPRRVPPTSEDLELAQRLLDRNREEAQRYLEQLQSQLTAHAEVRIVVGDDVSERLHDLLEDEDPDLIVVSAHGYSAGTKWPHGSVTSSFISHSTVPLLVIQDLSPAELERTKAERAVTQQKGH